MPDVLMYADTFRSPELRHEVPLGVPDPFLYVEKDGVKHISIGSMEIPRLAALGLFELHPLEEYGLDELIAAGKSLRRDQSTRSRCARSRRSASTKAVVPESFPLWLADRLRARGRRADRRRRLLRRPPPREDRGASSPACAAPSVPPRPGWTRRATCLRRAEHERRRRSSLDGEPLTVERVKTAMSQTFAAHGATADDFIVAPGAAGSGRARHGLRADPRRRADRDRHLAARQRVVRASAT